MANLSNCYVIRLKVLGFNLCMLPLENVFVQILSFYKLTVGYKMGIKLHPNKTIAQNNDLTTVESLNDSSHHISAYLNFGQHTKTKIAKYSGGEHTVNLSKSSYNSTSQEAIYRGRSYVER